MSVLSLQPGCTYGPISSRRYGSSLGINLMAGDKKVCSMNCVYCHYGWTALQTDDTGGIDHRLPGAREAAAAVREALLQARRSGAMPDALTFSGNGEPTIHNDFPAAVDRVLALRDELAPGVPVQVLSNSTSLDRPGALAALRKLDRRVMKLDAVTEDLFREVNRPLPGLTPAMVVEGLKSLGDVTVQTALLAGAVDNSGPRAIDAWLARLSEIAPLEVHIYTIDRPPAHSGIERVPRRRLDEIAALVEGAGLTARVF